MANYVEACAGTCAKFGPGSSWLFFFSATLTALSNRVGETIQIKFSKLYLTGRGNCNMHPSPYTVAADTISAGGHTNLPPPKFRRDGRSMASPRINTGLTANRIDI